MCSKSVSGALGGVVSCLDVVGDSTLAGAKLAIKPFDKSSSQRWIIKNKDSLRPATVTLQNVNSKLYVDTGATPVAGDRPTQQNFVAPSSQDTRGARQQFFIKPA
ncbi:RICIN domain-containing protein [Kribbella sp. NPDC023855]|uniref:RICIN domain-containing protein n=1 Tax=Kribbella sp. NPDC023855 TaxID=3154698 RepID=UPI0033C2BCE3